MNEHPNTKITHAYMTLITWCFLERVAWESFEFEKASRIYGVLATFNVADLSPYFDGDYLSDLRTNSS